MNYFECTHGPEYWKKKNKKVDEKLRQKPRIPCLFPTPRVRKLISLMKSEPVIVTMRFIGFITEEEGMSRLHRKFVKKMKKMRYHIVVTQQPCGSYSHIVFSKIIRPGDEIKFRSMRYEGHSFSLTIAIDGTDVTRVSQCCEYRQEGKLSGDSGLFEMVSVEGGYPCVRCKAAKDGCLKKRKQNVRTVHKKLQTIVRQTREELEDIEDKYRTEEEKKDESANRGRKNKAARPGSGKRQDRSKSQDRDKSKDSAKKKDSGKSNKR